MKKFRLLLTAGLAGVLMALPTSAFADIVDEISEDYGYTYRWTVEAELDETYEDSWLYEVSDDGKIRFSLIDIDAPLADSTITENGIIVLQGSKDVVMAIKGYNSSSGVSYVYNGRVQYVKDGDEWVEQELDLGTGDKSGIQIGVFATGDQKIEKRFLAIHVDDRYRTSDKSKVTVIGLDEDGLDEAEDTELSLLERRKYYIKYMGNRSPKNFSESGKVIWAKPIVREDKKSSGIDSDYYFEEEPEDVNDFDKIDETEENEVVYAPEKKIPDFDVTLEEAENSTIRKINAETVGDDVGYDYIVLNGKASGSAYHRSINSGKASFNIILPKEKVADISSNGKVSVSMQRYEVYATYLANKDMVFEPYDSVMDRADEIVVSLKGDLGEKVFYLNGLGDKYTEDGTYAVQYPLYRIFEMNDEIIAFVSHDRVPYEEGIGGFVDTKDENYIFTPIKDVILYCQFADSAYCGVEKIGFKFGDDICTVDVDDTKLDFDVEVDLSDRIIGTKAARKLLAEIRAERSKNNEVVNVLENGKPDFNTNIEPEVVEKPQEDEPEEPVVSADEICVDLRGKLLMFPDQKPIIENNRVLVPFRVIFEALEADVLWDGETRTVTATKGDITITLTIGDNKIIKNGEVIEIDVPAQIKNERTLVPIRVVSESFENTVSWDGENKIVGIK